MYDGTNNHRNQDANKAGEIITSSRTSAWNYINQTHLQTNKQTHTKKEKYSVHYLTKGIFTIFSSYSGSISFSDLDVLAVSLS